MIHITIERQQLSEAARLARDLYQMQADQGMHVVLDIPGDLRTNMPDRLLSSAEVLITAREVDADDATLKAMQTARDALGHLWMSFPECDDNARIAKKAMDALDDVLL